MARRRKISDEEIVRDRLRGRPIAQIARDRRITIDAVQAAIGRFADTRVSADLRKNLIETALLRLEACARTVLVDALHGHRDAQMHLLRLERTKCAIAGIFAAPGQLTVVSIEQAPAPGHSYDELRQALKAFERQDDTAAPSDETRH